MRRRSRRRIALALCFGLGSLASAQACGDSAPPERTGAAAPSGSSQPSPAKAPARPADPSGTETLDGYRVVRAKTKSGELTSIKLKTPKGWDVLPMPRTPDPQAGKFTLKEALAGLGPKKAGGLVARIETEMGSIYCDLYEDKTPNTVAAFVGMARGLRKFWDEGVLDWVARPYYDGTTFYRVLPGMMIYGGDHTDTGRGGVGFHVDDELVPGLTHDRPGQLCLDNRGANTGEARFFISEAALPNLRRRYTIFGQCMPVGVVQRIARVPQSGTPENRPLTPVVISHVEVKRVAGGAASWMPKNADHATALPTSVPAGRAVKVEPGSDSPTPGERGKLDE